MKTYFLVDFFSTLPITLPSTHILHVFESSLDISYNLKTGVCFVCRVWSLFLHQGHPKIVSVNYLFGKPLIPCDFLKRIVTSNFRDMRNLINVCCFRIDVVLGSEKRSAIIFGKAIRPKGVREMKKTALINSRILKFP